MFAGMFGDAIITGLRQRFTGLDGFLGMTGGQPGKGGQQ
jgi:hypothetical protein